MDTWTWLVAATHHGSEGIVLEASSSRTIERFEARHEGAKFDRYPRPAGRHWDGSKLDDQRAGNVRRGIARNA